MPCCLHVTGMKKLLAKPGLLILSLIAALTFALLSANFERIGPELTHYGNLCGPDGSGPCYKPALKGGFPVPYLFDQAGVSVERQLAFIEGEFFVGAFILDVAAYFFIVLFAIRLVSRCFSRGPNAEAQG